MSDAKPRPPLPFFHTANIVLVLLTIFVSYGSPAIARYYQLSIWWQLATGAASVMIFNLFPHVDICLLLFQIMTMALILTYRGLAKLGQPMVIRFIPAALFCTSGIITLFIWFLDHYVSLDFLVQHPVDITYFGLLFSFYMGNGVLILIMELVSYYGNAKSELISGIFMLCAGGACVSVYIRLLISWRRQGKMVQPTEKVPKVPPNEDGNI